MDPSKLFRCPKEDLQHLENGLSLSFISNKLIRKLNSLIDLIVVEGQWKKSNILNIFMISNIALEHVFEDKRLRFDDLA